MIQALTQGGSERQASIAALALHRRGWDCHVAVERAGGFRAEELERAGVPVHVFPVRSFRRDIWRQAWRLRCFLREHRFHTVHSFDTPGNMLAVPAAWAAGTPLVISSQRAHRSLAGPVWRRLLRLCDRLSHGVVVNCRYLIDHLVQDEATPPRKIHLCYNGLDTTLFQLDGPVAPLPFPAGSVVIGSVCALRPEKDLSVLVEAFARIVTTFPQARLLLVGSGPEREHLQALAARHQIAQLVHFEPSVADTAPWLRALHIFVLPSRSEAFSNSLMEAMACGATVVATAVGGNPELAAPGRGLLFPSGDAPALAGVLASLLDDPAQRKQLRRAASDWVRSELNLETMARTLEHIYETAAAPRPA